MAIRTVESKQNTRVKELRTALLRPANESGLVGLEGIHLIQEAARSGVSLETVFVAQDRHRLLQGLGLGDVEILSMPQAVLDSAVSTESPQPIAALARRRSWRWEDLKQADPLILVLAGVQDPGNLGTMLRSAEAFGAAGVISLPGTVSAWNPKTMRASAGSVFRVPVLELEPEDCFSKLRSAGVPAFATLAREAQPLASLDLAASAAFVIGSEGSGLKPELAAMCDGRVTIPCPGPVESLNAAVAASVLLYEASRQRAAVAVGSRS